MSDNKKLSNYRHGPVLPPEKNKSLVLKEKANLKNVQSQLQPHFIISMGPGGEPEITNLDASNPNAMRVFVEDILDL